LTGTPPDRFLGFNNVYASLSTSPTLFGIEHGTSKLIPSTPRPASATIATLPLS
jgi:hypothetical protein